MTEVIIVALITGICGIIAQMVISNRSTRNLYSEIDKRSEISDMRIEAKIERHQAVTDAKIEELTREVREHNNFAKRIPVLEEKVSNLEKKG